MATRHSAWFLAGLAGLLALALASRAVAAATPGDAAGRETAAEAQTPEKEAPIAKTLKKKEPKENLQETKDPSHLLVVGPYLQHSTQSTQVICWETTQPANSVVEWDEQLPLNHKTEAKGAATFHEIELRGLKTETAYFYRVWSRTGSGRAFVSGVYTFQTAVRKESPFAFVVFGDTRSFPDNFARIADAAYAERPNFVLHTGDVVTKGPEKDQWVNEFLAPAANLARRVPLYVAIGNHEKNDAWYYKYVSYPSPESYYSFDYGDAHFAILDSNEKDLGPQSAQYQWLEKDLAKSKALWKFTAHHHPPFDSDSDDYGDTDREKSTQGDLNVRAFVPLYEEYDVDICWVGHIHTYERTWPIREGKVDQDSGVIYIQTGGGGAPLEQFAPTRSWFTAKVLRNYEYCYVTIAGETLRMMAYDIDGRLVDFLELRK